jgi:ABC-type polysaccharide/polyol phosphate transport system ATPase subunit
VTVPAIELHGASLAYRLSRSASTSLKEHALASFKRQVRYEEKLALHSVDLVVESGEVLAVIGANGAGKSTLMKLMARVLPPTAGRVLVRGHVAPMIELGAGFNPDLTGLENTVLYGTLLGRTPRSMRDRAGAIAEWADLTDAMDIPLRAYSSGMVARLAFSIAVDAQPDVLLVDEVLSVGDESFQRKSEARLDGLIAHGSAVVLVTHNLAQVLDKATRAVWLDHGVVRRDGHPAEVVAAYRTAMSGPVEGAADAVQQQVAP